MDFSLDDLKQIADKTIVALKHWQFGNKKQLAFLEDAYVLINDGIPANRAIDMIAQVSTGLSKEVATSLSEKIAEGHPLADGMKEWFVPNVVEIIRIGETGGALAETLKSAINLLSQQGAAIGGLIAAVSYPLFVIVIACGVIIYLNSSVFVEFQAIKPMDQWPDAGRQLVMLAGLIKNWWWFVILIIFTLMIIFKWLMTNYVGEFRPALDNIPPFSFYKRFASARVLETLGLLVASGVVFKSAIKVMQHNSPPYIHSHLTMMEHLLGTGKTNIADVLATGLISEQDLVRLRLMAEVKGFEHGLIRMGVRGTELATATVKLISRIVGGVLLLIGGLLIIVMVRGIFMTGMSLGS